MLGNTIFIAALASLTFLYMSRKGPEVGYGMLDFVRIER